MPAPAIDTVYAWGDFFGFEGANAFTEFTRDWVPMVGAEHVVDDTAVAAHLYYGGHDSPMIARAGAYVQAGVDPLEPGEPLWTSPIEAGLSALTDTGNTGEVEVELSPAMPDADFWVLGFPRNEPLPPGKPPRLPWVVVRLKNLPGVDDTFRLIIQKDTTVQGQNLDNGPSSPPSSGRDLSFGFLVFHGG